MLLDNKIKSQINDLYNQNRYIDAYRIVKPILTALDHLRPTSAEGLIELGRLCGRLGSNKLRFKLFHQAQKMAPKNPIVRLYTGPALKYRRHILVQLRELEKPPPTFADPSQQAIWLASYTLMLTAVRDFERAHDLIKQAETLQTESAWVNYCLAELLNTEDRWEEALHVAQQSWTQSPGMPQTAQLLGKILTKHGRLDLALERILPIAEKGQSYETLMIAIWYLCAQAERTDDHHSQQEMAAQAFRLSDRLAPLAPLADKATQSNIAACRMDIALLLQDKVKIEAQAPIHHIPFYQSVLTHIKQHPQAPRHLLPFLQVYQAHQTCLPTSVSAILGRFKIDIDINAPARELTFKGTSMWRLIDWLKAKSLYVKPFITDPALSQKLILAGLPFVYLMESVQYFHATAAVGIDPTAGLLIIHDPSQIRWDLILLDEIGLEEKPFGPEALAIVPQTHAHLLELIPEEAHQPYAQYQAYLKIWETQGPKAGAPIVEALNHKYPNHPFSDRLKGLHYALTGRLAEAIQIQEALLRAYPDSAQLRREMLDSLYRTGNTARIHNTLKDIVVRHRMPGIRAKQKWRYPPAEYIAKYADYLGANQTGFKQAEMILLRALAREPFHGLSYHILGDVLLRQGRLKSCILPYRCAATLEFEDNHYARAFCDALAKIGKVEEGFHFLEHRVSKLGHRLRGGSVWIALIGAYEDYGYPDRAIEEMLTAAAHRYQDAELQSFAVSFWIRMGYWEKAHEALQRVNAIGHTALYLRAAVAFYQRSGNWQKGLRLTSEWIQENPDDYFAHEHYAHLITLQDGRLRALELTRQWMRSRPGNDAFEELHYDMLKNLNREAEQKALLKKRLERNPQEAWAWRELGFCIVNQLRDTQRISLKDRSALKIVLENCERLCPDQEATWTLKADLAESENNHRKACQYALRALTINPGYTYCYTKAWTCSSLFAESEQLALIDKLQRILFHAPGFLYNAGHLAFLIAERCGPQMAGNIVESWLKKAPGDPEVVKARADLLLYYGQGVSDAEKAALMLEAETVRFPNHSGLRYSLADAYRIMLAEEKQINVLEEILRRNPLDHSARGHLATVLTQREEWETALSLLEEGCRFDPSSEELYMALTTLHTKSGRLEQVIELMDRSLHILPDSTRLRRHYITLLQENGKHLKAIEIAQQGTRITPQGAYMWFLLGEALATDETPDHQLEIEKAYRKAFTLNPNLLEALARLTTLLCERREFQAARDLINKNLDQIKEPVHAQVLLAQIERYAGHPEESITQLITILRECPKIPYAWKLLLNWLKEDRAWPQFRSILPHIPPNMQNDPDFVAEKLAVCELAGISATPLDAEWQTLLNNFPENEFIHYLRFDLLIKKERWDPAGQVITAIEKYHAPSVHVRARKIAFLAHSHPDEALQQTLALWHDIDLESTWPLDYTWQIIEKENLAAPLLLHAFEDQLGGSQLHPRAFGILVDNIETFCNKSTAWGRFLIRVGLRQNEPAQKLKQLLHSKNTPHTEQGYFHAVVLEKLIGIGKTRYVLSYWRKNKPLCRQHTKIWQIMGSMLTHQAVKKNAWAVNWLENWHLYPDCELWAVANYVEAIMHSQSLSDRARSALIIQTCQDALRLLPYDHSVRYMVSILCETCLRNGQDELFLEYAQRFETILNDDSGNYWIDPKYAWAPKILLLFKELLNTTDNKHLKPLTLNFNHTLPIPAVTWIQREWHKRQRGFYALNKS